jgi:chaperonin GroES
VQMPVRPGDHVVFPASAGTWIEVDEERLLVCRVTELLGILERVEEPMPDVGFDDAREES